MAEMDKLFRELCPAGSPQVLLHGDLHHENMLQGSDGEWKAIDPQGVIGPLFFETGRFIENQAIDDDGLCLETFDEAVGYLAGRLGESKRTIAGATFILDVLSTCWGYQMGYDAARINQQIGQCEESLQYARRV
jgi:streptomycin 6-kinase